MSWKCWIWIGWTTVAIGLGAAESARAQLAIVNQGFESPPLGPNGFTSTVPPGWTLAAGADPNTGVFHPTTATWNYVAPFGNQVLYLNGASVEQQLATQVVAGETYQLAVSVVRRPGYLNPAYRIDFFAGSVLLGSDLGTIDPPSGQAGLSRIVYTAGPGDPAIGQPLKIRLGGPTQTNFDNVRVFVPEPGMGRALAVAVPAAGLALRCGRTSSSRRAPAPPGV